MRADTLKSPGTRNGQTLRHESANAISKAEIAAGRGSLGTAVDLAAFFTDCASKLSTQVTAAQPNTAQTTAVAAPSTGAAGILVTHTFTIKNAAGAPLSGLDVTVARTGTATGGTVSALSGVTNALGQFVVTTTGTIAGTIIHTITCTYAGATAVKAATATLS